MKTLILMRHGKSSWKDVKKDEDMLRPLSKKGEKDAKLMGTLLEEKKILPQVILTSTARRARETANVFLNQCCAEITFNAIDTLYMAEPTAVIDILKTIQNRYERVMIIGHNPGLEGLLQHLTGKVESLPTASVVCLALPIDNWDEISLDLPVETWEKWKPKNA